MFSHLLRKISVSPSKTTTENSKEKEGNNSVDSNSSEIEGIKNSFVQGNCEKASDKMSAERVNYVGKVDSNEARKAGYANPEKAAHANSEKAAYAYTEKAVYANTDMAGYANSEIDKKAVYANDEENKAGNALFQHSFTPIAHRTRGRLNSDPEKNKRDLNLEHENILERTERARNIQTVMAQLANTHLQPPSFTLPPSLASTSPPSTQATANSTLSPIIRPGETKAKEPNMHHTTTQVLQNSEGSPLNKTYDTAEPTQGAEKENGSQTGKERHTGDKNTELLKLQSVTLSQNHTVMIRLTEELRELRKSIDKVKSPTVEHKLDKLASDTAVQHTVVSNQLHRQINQLDGVFDQSFLAPLVEPITNKLFEQTQAVQLHNQLIPILNEKLDKMIHSLDLVRQRFGCHEHKMSNNHEVFEGKVERLLETHFQYMQDKLIEQRQEMIGRLEGSTFTVRDLCLQELNHINGTVQNVLHTFWDSRQSWQGALEAQLAPLREEIRALRHTRRETSQWSYPPPLASEGCGAQSYEKEYPFDTTGEQPAHSTPHGLLQQNTGLDSNVFGQMGDQQLSQILSQCPALNRYVAQHSQSPTPSVYSDTTRMYNEQRCQTSLSPPRNQAAGFAPKGPPPFQVWEDPEVKNKAGPRGQNRGGAARMQVPPPVYRPANPGAQAPAPPQQGNQLATDIVRMVNALAADRQPAGGQRGTVPQMKDYPKLASTDVSLIPEFYANFDRFVKRSMWTEQEALVAFESCLEGLVLGIYKEIPQNFTTIKDAKEALSRALTQNTCGAGGAMGELMGMAQKDKETIDKFYERVKGQVELVPNNDSPQIMEIAISAFIRGLRNEEVSQQIERQNPQNLHETALMARKEEELQKRSKHKGGKGESSGSGEPRNTNPQGRGGSSYPPRNPNPRYNGGGTYYGGYSGGSYGTYGGYGGRGGGSYRPPGPRDGGNPQPYPSTQYPPPTVTQTPSTPQTPPSAPPASSGNTAPPPGGQGNQ